MRLRAITSPSFALLAAAALAVACKEQTPVSHAPTSIIVLGGANQSANVSTPLDSLLVVQVLDGVSKPVSGVALAWTVVGGGSLSATTTTTDANGKSSVKWTLAPTPGTQVVTVTSSQITGANASFVANNGATITGSVTVNGALPFAATYARTARSARLFTPSPRAGPARVSNNVVVGFRSDALGVASIGASAYRAPSTARSATSIVQSRLNVLLAGRPVADVRISPAILAARITVTDTTQIAATMRALAADPSVAYVERDGILSIRDGAPRPTTATMASLFPSANGAGATGAATRLPNDGNYYLQTWTSNMLDLPKAWSITTGSASVTVAVVDMGIRFDHPSMGTNVTSDGYDFVSKFDFSTPQPICGGGTFTSTNGDGDGPDPDPTDPDDLEFDSANNCWVRSTVGDHGLWTSGIIGAVGNQNIGMAGVNWTVKIRPIRVLDITGSGSYFDIAQGVLYAAGLPAVGAGGAMVQTTRAPIINMSLGGPDTQTSLANAVAAATSAGSLVVASSGNDGLDDSFPTYPAAYPGVMAVAAVGMDGALTTYSNVGTYISVSAPGGDFRLDDNGGGGVLGPGWNFVSGRPNLIFAYGTSASAPYVSGIAALLLAQTPTLTAAQLRSRIETYATRPANALRSDSFGWGIVNAYNALTQTAGAPRSTIVRLVDAVTGAIGRTAAVDANGNFAFTKVATGSYLLQAGEDESGDATIGTPGRRFAIAGGAGKPTVFNVNANALSAAIVLGMPTEVEPNDDIAHANLLSVNSYVVGNITTPDVVDVYSVPIPAAGIYTFETSGVVGSCGLGIELDTFISVTTAAGALVGSNDNFSSATGRFCSRVQKSLTPGIYYVTVSGSAASGLASHGRYRLEVRAGT